MFGHALKHRVLGALREKDLAFWTLLFPILLATLFQFTIGSLDAESAFSAIPVAVVDDAAYRRNLPFRQALSSVSKAGEDQLFSTRAVSREAAEQLLEAGEVAGIIELAEDAPQLTVTQSGLSQTIIKSFLDVYAQTASSAGRIVELNFASLLNGLVDDLIDRGSFTEEVPLTQSRPSETVNYFYALLAMTCLYGSFQGMDSAMRLQANLSSLGARRSLAPVSKGRLALYDLLSGYIVHAVCVLIVLLYIAGVLGVNFGSRIHLVVLGCLAGSLVGVALGALVAASNPLKAAVKNAILVCVTMVCCFLAGLMVSGINYEVEKAAPLVAWLNPAARVVDAFYCLYYYDTYERYFLDLLALLLMSAALLAGAAVFLRRQRYESL